MTKAHPLGRVFQNGYMVEDLDEALDYWINTLGAGPFYKFEFALDYYLYKGVEQPQKPVMSVAMGQFGDVQIELMQQINDAPSSYLDFLNEHGPGLQHVGVIGAHTPENLKAWEEQGLVVDTVCEVSGARAIFYAPQVHAGTMIEMANDTPQVRGLADMIREASIDWDGSDPVRTTAF